MRFAVLLRSSQSKDKSQATVGTVYWLAFESELHVDSWLQKRDTNKDVILIRVESKEEAESACLLPPAIVLLQNAIKEWSSNGGDINSYLSTAADTADYANLHGEFHQAVVGLIRSLEAFEKEKIQHV